MLKSIFIQSFKYLTKAGLLFEICTVSTITKKEQNAHSHLEKVTAENHVKCSILFVMSLCRENETSISDNK